MKPGFKFKLLFEFEKKLNLLENKIEFLCSK